MWFFNPEVHTKRRKWRVDLLELILLRVEPVRIRDKREPSRLICVAQIKEVPDLDFIVGDKSPNHKNEWANWWGTNLAQQTSWSVSLVVDKGIRTRVESESTNDTNINFFRSRRKESDRSISIRRDWLGDWLRWRSDDGITLTCY
jgi:hypothetical protein